MEEKACLNTPVQLLHLIADISVSEGGSDSSGKSRQQTFQMRSPYFSWYVLSRDDTNCLRLHLLFHRLSSPVG